MKRTVLLLFILAIVSTALFLVYPFVKERPTSDRTRTAAEQKEESVNQLFAEKGISYPPQKIYIRIFKKQDIVELWAWSGKDQKYELIKSYDICYASGSAGPKRREGDKQVPEGFYHIDRFNPRSNYYLSLGINYPNGSDRILGVRNNLGGDIFIHGGCVSVGCVAITDDKIKELYLIAADAKTNGQGVIPVHIYPARLDDEGLGELRSSYGDDEELYAFWLNLKEGYDIFEESRTLPNVRVDENGKYVFSN